MPHINRIRVNNVRYNFGTQFYDDFIMRFDGKNVLYDLANGGGKSVLLLLLLQNLIPNCTLDDKQPVEKLFRGNNGSTVIHSLIEWKLDDYLVKDDYRYMLTGFCARKAREEDEQKASGEVASIEYFNYVIFYRHYNDNDLVNLPLSDGKERITYPGLKSYLKNLARKDYQLQVHLFERKGEYQQFISRYGLYESEWEIIRGINKTEGHVRTYFESNYRTTRKVVEDLLIEEIIRKAFIMRTSDGNADTDGQGDTALMADTLYQIKDQLAELTRKKQEIRHYDEQKEVLDSLGQRIQTLDHMYQEEEAFRYDIVRTWQTAALNGRMKSRDLSVAVREKENAAGQIEELSRKLDTVRIQSSKEQLASLEAITSGCRTELQQLKEQMALTRDDLNLRESMNDYLDYLEEQGKYQVIAHSVNHAASGQQELLTLLGKYAAEWQSRYQQRCRELDRNLLAEKQALHLKHARRQQAEAEERETDRLIAVLEHDQELNHGQEKELLRQFGHLRDQSGILIIEEVDKTLREYKRQLNQTEQKMAALEQEKMNADRKLQEFLMRLEQIEPNLRRVQESIHEQTDFMQGWQDSKEKLKKLLDIYQVKDMAGLRQQLYDRFCKAIYEIEAKRQQILGLEKRIGQLEENNPLVMTEDVQQLMEYIRTCHGITCVFGADYLKTLSAEERRPLLRRMPMLPYAIIVKEGFSKIVGDILLKEKDFGSHVIPITGLETVLSEHVPVNEEYILFAGKGSSYYLEEDLIEKEKKGCETELEQCRVQLERLQDQQETYHKDMEDFNDFLRIYDDRIQERREHLASLQKMEQELLDEQQRSGREKARLEEQAERIELERETTGKALTQCQEKYTLLVQLKEVNSELADLRGQLAEGDRKLQQARTRKQEQLDEIADLDTACCVLTDRCQAISDQRDMLVHEWKEYWQLYAAGQDDVQVSEFAELDDDALKAAFLGVREAYEKEHLDLADKRQLMESYGRSMERLMKSIRDRNQQPEHLENMNQSGQLYRTSDEKISDIREAMQQISDKIENLQKKLTVMEADRNRLCGSVSQAVTVIEERYGVYKEVNLNDQSYESFTQNVMRLLDEASARHTAAERTIERLTRDTYGLEGLRRDLERLMSMYHVGKELTTETYGADLNLKQKYEALHQKHEHLQQQYFARREAFEKDKSKAVASLRILGAQGLAAEISEHMNLPESAEAAGQIMEGIQETIQLIEIEKRRIEKNMTDLLTVKANFENQCLQICRNIRMELDKLPKMSVIVMDGEKIQMLGLAIPYIKETLYQQQMSAYIDEIVENADRLNAPEDKIRYIRQQLAWKKLFSVIVTDMNAIRLTLYKRERIREQSRYLKYEEAVGSTGQSQGIYIQFLIAIIHYISCIHAGASSGESLKKVIFIDNPFGAAKDIYIWEPIFALLQTNDVQLIVPARGATPAITGKFDVNYVLGQKLIGNRQQTIVVDYHSNIVIEEMEYVRIDYEQEVFDFV